MTETVVQIVPSLPPPAEGVGGYALALGEILREHAGLPSRFLPARHLPALTAEALSAALEETGGHAVLLHYAGYGYHPRGCPSWLVRALEGWAREGRRLVTIFHEVWAMGPPWRSSFWLSPLQRRLAGALARSSAGVVTSLELYRRNLLGRAPGREVFVLPVFSTVGEPASVPALAERSRRLVVFGGPGARGRAFREVREALEAACRELGIAEICDVGPPLPERPQRVAGVPVRSLGVLPAAEVSALLLDSLAGFVAYPAPFLAKSTIFAAYASHGLLPVSAWHRPRREAETPPPFWRPGAPDEPQAVADRARAWYAGHSLDRHAAVYRSLLAG
ncbi:MAG TPA: glycosyltransferase family 1 protein [Thermoanaerobaculia bacterium]|nr:glycosyltransferase family 1 protein [Thermoanaerobaculia bacterium]